MNDSLLLRFIGAQLVEHLATMPAVIVAGARQTGKSTLARAFAPGDRLLAFWQRHGGRCSEE